MVAQHADLCLADVLHCEVEPHAEAGVAGVGPDEEVELELTDVVNTAKVPCRDSETAYISIKWKWAVHNTESHTFLKGKVHHKIKTPHFSSYL